jgi:hypothetical protein
MEVAHYWAWHLERAKWIGLLCQVLGLMLFLAVWWHQDRGWRVCRWLLALYFCVLGLFRFSLWLLYGSIAPSPNPIMQAFITRSGAVGLTLCIAAVVLLILDRSRLWISFNHFGPEHWNRLRPTPIQWFGLAVVIAALWSPFAPHPTSVGSSLFVYGFPTSFGVTLTPVLLYLGGLFLAGSRPPRPGPVAWTGIGAALSALLVDPITLHGLVAAFIGLLLVGAAYIGRNQGP